MTDRLWSFFLTLLSESTRPGWEDDARLGGVAVLLAIGVFGLVRMAVKSHER